MNCGRARTRTARIILAEADREAQITPRIGRLRGPPRSMPPHSDGTGEFYKLYRSLNAYRTAFGSNADILLLEPTSEFFDYFKGSGVAAVSCAAVVDRTGTAWS